MAARVEEMDSLARALAALVIVARARFQEVYDELWKEIKANDAAQAYTGEPFLSAVLGPDLTPPANDMAAFTGAFAAAEAGGWLKLLVRRCVELTAIDSSAVALLQPRRPKSRGAVKTVLQAAVDRLSRQYDPNKLMSGFQRTMPKICLVHARLDDGGASQGTGFLVGPQTVLTAWHVIAPLLDETTGAPKPASHQRLHVEFDFVDPLGGGSARQNVKAYEVVERWLEDHSSCNDWEKPSPKGIAVSLKSPAVDRTRLDFAVIRLKGSPGRDRGVVNLCKDPLQARKGQWMFVFQHPNQFPQRVADGPFVSFFGPGIPPPRFRHNATTAKGSSGGLCVDSEFVCVGLHQATVLNAKGVPVVNQAVPTALIAPQLVGAYNVDVMLDPLMKLKDTQEPVIGRETLQRSVWKVVRGEKRIVAVRGRRRRGMSFTKHILRSLLPAKDTLIVQLTADQIGRDALALADKLLHGCGGQLGPGEKFPLKTAAATTPFAWLRDQLLPDLARRIQTTVARKQVWVVLDDLDLHTPPEDDAFNFLLALMTAQAEAPFMRFLLIGMDKVPTVIGALSEPDQASWPLASDVDAYIQRYCTLNNIPMTGAERTNWVNATLREAQKKPDDQWVAAVGFLIDHVHSIKAGP